MYKAAGPCSLYREQLSLNPTEYTTTPGVDSDDFRTTSSISGYPSNPSHVVDSTAYATQPTLDSWQMWLAAGNQV